MEAILKSLFQSIYNWIICKLSRLLATFTASLNKVFFQSVRMFMKSHLDFIISNHHNKRTVREEFTKLAILVIINMAVPWDLFYLIINEWQAYDLKRRLQIGFGKHLLLFLEQGKNPFSCNISFNIMYKSEELYALLELSYAMAVMIRHNICSQSKWVFFSGKNVVSAKIEFSWVRGMHCTQTINTSWYIM